MKISLRSKLRRVGLIFVVLAFSTTLTKLPFWSEKTYFSDGHFYARDVSKGSDIDNLYDIMADISVPAMTDTCLDLLKYSDEMEAADKGQSDREDSKQIPHVLKGLIRDRRELKGRHSDYITPQCINNGSLPSRTEKKYGFLGPFQYLDNYKNPCWLSSQPRKTDPHGTTSEDLTENLNQTRIRCVPYFYLIAAKKSGSTDVFWKIREHPHVNSGRAKEFHWFSIIRYEAHLPHFDKALPEFESYLDFFKTATTRISRQSVQTQDSLQPYHHQVLVDGSPTYYSRSFDWPLMPGNEGCDEPRVTAMSHIHHLWPKAKLIMVLRNPVTRLFSSYLYNGKGREEFNKTAAQFDSWIRQSRDMWIQCLARMSVRACLYDKEFFSNIKIKTFVESIYSRYILDLLKIFPRKQIFFVQMESYTNNSKETLRDIFDFLDLPPLSEERLDVVSEIKHMNRGRNYDAVPEMWPSTRRLLEDFYAPYNAELAAIMDGDTRWCWDSSF